MKLILPFEKLKKGIEIVSKVATKKSILPILENYLLVAEKNFFGIYTTNLETGISWKGLAKIEKEGKICVRKKIFENLFSFPLVENVELEKKDLNLEIKTKDFYTKIKGEDPEEFPIIPKPQNEESIIVNSQKFTESLKMVLDLPSSSLGRPEIGGVLLSFSSEGIKIVGTDSFRLGEKKIFQKLDLLKPYNLILPKESAKEVFNIFSKEDKELKIYLSQNQIFFETQMIETLEPEVVFVSKLIEGEYPNYEEIIPKKFETEALVKTEDFFKKIKTASLFSSKINEIKLNFLPKEKKIEIKSENPDLGEFKSEIFSEIKGKEMKISFNYKFLLEGILSIDEENFNFCLTSPEGPAMLKPLRDQTYYYLLMPIKTD